MGNCYEMLTKEFLVISMDCDNPMSPEFQKVYVRGKCVNFSPFLINQYLGRSSEDMVELEATQNEICKTLTGGLVKVWPRKNLPAAKLTTKYAILNKIASFNWAPTTHSNSVATGLSKVIYAIGTKLSFDETVLHGKSLAVKMPIAFPTLICGIILDQHPDILTKDDVPAKRLSDLSLDDRLFTGRQVTDFATPNAAQDAARNAMQHPEVLTRDEMIVQLESVSRMLGEKKNLVDSVVYSLKYEKAQAEGGEGPSDVTPTNYAHDSEDTEEEGYATDESPLV